MEKFIYDRSLRELLQKIPTKFVKLIINKEIKEILDISFPSVKELKVDLLARLEDDTIFHLEIQSTNDNKMPNRMLLYAALIYERYNKFPKQVVLYVGEKKLNIKNSINDKNISFTYEVKDIRDFDCIDLIESDDINDNILALLCNVKNIDKFFDKLRKKLLDMPEKERADYLRKVFYLFRLRPSLQIKFKEKNMPFRIEITKENDPILYDMLLKEKEKGKIEGKIESAVEMVKKFNLPIKEVCKSLDIDESLLKKALGV